MRNLLIVLSIIFIITGCSTSSVTLNKLDYSLYTLKKVTERVLPLGRKDVSENGRVYYSKYFLKVGKKIVNAEKLKIRKQAIVKILGDRRPYEVEVTVINERQVKRQGEVVPTYTETSKDKNFAKLISRKIIFLLNKRQDGVNVIDDFRVF